MSHLHGLRLHDGKRSGQKVYEKIHSVARARLIWSYAKERMAFPGGEASVKIDHLAFDQLIELKERIDSLIQSKLEQERASLLQKLDVLHRFESRMGKVHTEVHHSTNGGDKKNTTHGNGRSKGRGKAPPKYKDPVTGTTWAGRGKQPRWMRKAIESGKTPNEFLIPTEN